MLCFSEYGDKITICEMFCLPFFKNYEPNLDLINILVFDYLWSFVQNTGVENRLFHRILCTFPAYLRFF